MKDSEDSELFTAETFTITSYGADYPVDAIVKRMRTKAYFVPPFQRMFIWTQKQASRFIESLLLGLPVPGIFVFKEDDSNRHLIIDGQQRLKSLEAFYNGTLRDRAFRLQDVREPWKGKTYEELDEEDQLRLDDSIVHTTVFRQENPEDDNQSVYEVFERINSGGMKLSAQEIRSCVNYGPATKLLSELNCNQDWRAVFGRESNRLKDQELILRYLAMYQNYGAYKKPMSGFLNSYMKSIKQLSVEHSDELKAQWCNTIEFCRHSIGEKIFRPERPLNAAVFDSVTVGVAKRLDSGPVKKPKMARMIYLKLVRNSEFIDAYERGTSDEERVKKRMKLAIDAFSDLQ